MEQLWRRAIKKNLQISIVIPTYHRMHDLNTCLDSILTQTTLPEEIIIVDDSDNNEIEQLIQRRLIEFKNIKIVLKYLRNERDKSLTISRNLGVKNAIGDIILFLDSDVILENKYIEEILKMHKKKPDAIGVQGYITNSCKFTRSNKLLRRLFFQSNLEKEKCRILTSVMSTYPYELNHIISCEWLSGANCSFRKEIFNNFMFDEKIRRYDDIDFSYRIFKKYPGSLLITPDAKLIHIVSKAGRLPKKESTYLNEVNRLYYFYNNINQTFINNIIFFWSSIGFIIFNYKNINPKQFICAYLYALKHLNEIKKGDLDFLKKL
ncbi:Glycosyltransferase AglG [uncultured archaeon]|nr:Glycosyltransferase AglG [uncultured archaeon]